MKRQPQGRKWLMEPLENRFMLSAVPLSDQVVIAETLAPPVSAPSVAMIDAPANMDLNGDFVLAWTSFEEAGGDTSGLGIYAQVFEADGTPKSARVLVNAYPDLMADPDLDLQFGDQDAPVVAVDGEGNFVVAWQTQNVDATGFQIYAQRFNADASADGKAFLVHTEQAGDQKLPAIAMNNAGDFVIAWQSFGQDDLVADDYGIYARQYLANGTAGSEFPVNTTTLGDQIDPTVAMDRDGSAYVIAWEGVTGEEAVEIFAQRYDFALGAQGTEFQVNTNPDKEQVTPVAAMANNGNFVIAWVTEGIQGSGSDVFAQLFNADGSFNSGLTDANPVNVTTLQGQNTPAVGMDGAGNFIITWQSSHQDGFSWGIFGNEYDADGGDPLVTEFQVNTAVDGPQTFSAVGMNSSGQAIVTWVGNDADHLPAIFGQRYQTPLIEPDFSVGGELKLTNYMSLEDEPASVAVDGSGNYIVAWQSYGEDGSGLGIFARRVGPDGIPLDPIIAVNTTTLDNQMAPEVAAAADGSFVVVWQSADEDGTGIFGQRFALAVDGVTIEKVGPEFQVNPLSTSMALPPVSIAGNQVNPNIAMDASGRFVVLWESTDASLSGIFAQRFSADATPLGDPFQLNQESDLDQVSADISMNAAGQWVAAWVSDHQALDPNLNDSEKTIFLQTFATFDAPIADTETLAHVITSFEAQEYPAVAMEPDGDFVLIWQSINEDGNAWGVFGRQFNADETAKRPQFQVNDTVTANQRHASVAVDMFGNFVVSWQSDLQDGAATAIISRHYDYSGQEQTTEFVVNNWTQGPQIRPVMASTLDGNYGVIWLGQGTGRTEGVHGKFYVSQNPDLTVSKTECHETTAAPSESIVYVITYQNLGDADATGVILTEQLPENTTFDPTHSTVGWVHEGDGVYTRKLGTLAVGADPEEVRFGVIVDARIEPGFVEFLNSVTITDDGTHGPDLDLTNNTATDGTPFQRRAVFATGADAGGGPHVRVFDAATGLETIGFFAFNPEFLGGVRVAMGDVNNDGTPDIIASAGPGGGPHVRIFDSLTGEQLPGPLGSFFAYDVGFSGGVYVASADVDGDGYDDVVTGAGAGGGPHVRVYSGATGLVLHDFYAYDPGFTGGVRVAAAQVNADDKADVITGAGPGGGPHVRVFDGATGEQLPGPIGSFFAYNAGFTGGLYVSAGNFDGDSLADIVTGADAGGGPHVKVFSAVAGAELHSFFAFHAGFTGGVRVSAMDVNLDGIDDILTANGMGEENLVIMYDGETGLPVSDFDYSLQAYSPTWHNGVFVGGYRDESGPSLLASQAMENALSSLDIDLAGFEDELFAAIALQPLETTNDRVFAMIE